MWLDKITLASRFKSEYTDEEKREIDSNLSFTFDGKTYEIQDMQLQISEAFLYYTEFQLNESLPKQISSEFFGHSIVLTQLTESSRQNVNLFFPPEMNCTDICISFCRKSDLNANEGNTFSNCRALPPELQEMSLTEIKDIQSESNIYQNFYLKDLHIHKMNLSWSNYLNYLVDNCFLDIKSSQDFFSTEFNRLNTDTPIEKKGHNACSIFPLRINSTLPQDRPLISVKNAQINYSPLSLNLVFKTSPPDLSKYYCCVTYFNKYVIDFNLGQNTVQISPIVCK